MNKTFRVTIKQIGMPARTVQTKAANGAAAICKLRRTIGYAIPCRVIARPA
jgi:hypothetical protein